MQKNVNMGGDGMSMDERRNICITKNVFAGADQKTLFITVPANKVNALRMNVSVLKILTRINY
ncbi:MAG TPA: hypothetical protein VD884_08725 [Ohtaekwangia sp.]|nr:hypothetical protein [Ohtaekwangia sp.]